MSENYVISIQVEGQDKGASGVLDGLGGSLKRVGEFVVGGLLVGGIQRVGRAIGGLAKNAVTSVGNIQNLEKSMQGMLAQNLMYENVTNSVTVATSLSEKQQESLLKAQIKFAQQTARLNKFREAGSDLTELQVMQMKLLEGQTSSTADTISRLSGVEGGFATITQTSIQQTRSFEEASGLAKAQVQDLLRFVEKLSIISPFETADVEQVTKIGLAARLSVGEVKDFTAAFLDFSAVMGITDIKFAAEQFLQLKQAGALTTIDLRQLRRMGIDVSRIIGTDLSGSVEEATERFGELTPEALKVFKGMDLDIKSFNATAKDSPEVLDAIFQKFILLSEQTTAGAAADMATTVSGMMSTTADIIEIGSRKLFRPILEAVGPPIAGVLEKVSDFVTSPEIEAIGQKIGDAVGVGIEIFTRFTDLLKAGADPITAIKIAISGLVPPETAQKIFDIANTFSNLISAFQEFSTLLSRGDIGFLEALSLTIEQFAPEEFAGKLMAIVDSMMELRDTAAGIFEEIFGFLIDNSDLIINIGLAIGAVLASGAVIAGVTALGTAITALATAAIPLLISAVTTLLSPLALLLGFVTLVAVAWTKDWLGIRTAIEPVILWFMDAIKRLPETLALWKQNLDNFPIVVGIIWERVKQKFSELVEGVKLKVDEIKNSLQEKWEAIKISVQEKIDAIATGIQEKWESINVAIQNKLNAITTGIQNKWEMIRVTIQNKIDAIATGIQEKWESIKQTASNTWQSIQDAIMEKVHGLFEAMGLDFDEMIARWTQIWLDLQLIAGAAWDAIKERVAEAVAGVIMIVAGISLALFETWIQIRNTIVEAWDGIVATLSEKWELIKTSLAEVWTSISTTLSETWTSISTMASEKFNEIKTTLAEAWTSVSTTVSEKWEEIKTILSEAWTSISTTASEKFEEIKTTLIEVWDAISIAIQEKLEAIFTPIQEKFDTAKTGIDTKMEETKTSIGVKWDEIKTTILTKIDGIVTAIGTKVAAMVQAGKDLIAGVARGITAGAGAVLESITSALEGAIAAAKAKLGIQSPSSVMANIIGAPMAQGVGIGWIGEMSALQGTIGDSLRSTTQNIAQGAQDNRTIGGDTFDVQINDSSAAEQFMGFIEDRRSQRLGAAMGAA